MQVLNTVEIRAKVLRETKEALQGHKERLGLTLGEVIDRMTLQCQTTDPGIASVILGEQLVLVTGEQTEEQMKETMLLFTALVKHSCLKIGMSEEEYNREVNKRLPKKKK